MIKRKGNLLFAWSLLQVADSWKYWSHANLIKADRNSEASDVHFQLMLLQYPALERLAGEGCLGKRLQEDK